ncbi:MAG: aminotransferase class V-fold PLP-dependent enzyme [Acidobacteria bacterium]|nr:aminotransferase class V-fold PLP-dependent enzyme [Acidobacteriota bacterium]
MPNWSEVRELYPSLKRWTFFNSATFGQISRRSLEAMEAHFRRREETAASDFLSWFEDADRLRGKLATLIHSSPDDIAFLPNTSTALGILLNGIDWRPGDEIVTLEDEFPNQIYAPLHQGPALKEVPAAGLLDAITPNTRAVVVSSVNYTTGFRAPLEAWAPELRRRGVLLYVDATQMLGALRFDFEAIQPDILAVNCYKWMLAPNGIAFMAVHPGLRGRLRPLSVGWRSHYDWRNVNNLWHGKPELKTTAEKYEGGMLPSSLMYALEASVDLMLELTPEAIEQRVLQLASQTRALFPGALPFEDTAIVAAKVDDAPALSARLRQQGILTAARHGMLRVSTHFYNDESDIARLAEAL